jgi:hypothetical protein
MQVHFLPKKELQLGLKQRMDCGFRKPILVTKILGL